MTAKAPSKPKKEMSTAQKISKLQEDIETLKTGMEMMIDSISEFEKFVINFIEDQKKKDGK